jgi:hypothetical protein
LRIPTAPAHYRTNVIKCGKSRGHCSGTPPVPRPPADYTIADMAVFPWYGGLAKGWSYGAAEFPSVQQLHERHDGGDFETKTRSSPQMLNRRRRLHVVRQGAPLDNISENLKVHLFLIDYARPQCLGKR